MKAKLMQVIETHSLKGDGKIAPIRKVIEYWSVDGKLLATNDTLEENKNEM